MRFRPLSFGCCLVALLWGASVLAEGEAVPAKRPETPASAPAPAPGGRQDRLLLLELRLRNALRGFKPEFDSNTPQPRRAPAPVVTDSRRYREKADREKNWAFADPKDLNAAPSVEELMNVPQYGKNGEEKKKLTLQEEFYQRLQRRDEGKPEPGAPWEKGLWGERKPASSNPSETEQDAKPSKRARDTEEGWRKLLGLDSASTASAPRSSWSDIFGLGEQRGFSRNDEIKHKAYMEEYRQILDRTRQATAPNAVNPLAQASSTRPSAGYSGFSGSSARLAQPGVGAAPALTVPGLPGSSVPDLNARILNQWNPLYTPQAPTPPKATTPGAGFEVPHRAFR